MKISLLPGMEIEIALQAMDLDSAPLSQHKEAMNFFFDQMLKFEAPTILDVGAGVGFYALLAKFLPGATVHAFEPLPIAREMLRENIGLNGLESRIIVYPFALLDKAGMGKLKLAGPHETGLSTLGRPLRGQTEGWIEVETKCLDDLSFPDGVDLIKIDVEGAELLVLQGGEKTIKKYNPGILMEYAGFNTQQFDYKLEKINRLLEGWGYELRSVGGRDAWATPISGKGESDEKQRCAQAAICPR